MAVFNLKKYINIRKQKNITMTALAKISGISRRSLWAWEHNERVPPENKIYTLANALKINVSEISDLTDYRPTEKMDLPHVDENWKLLANDEEIKEEELFHSFLHKINIYHTELKKSTIVIKALLASMNGMLYIKNNEHTYITANRSFLENSSYAGNMFVYGKKDGFFFSRIEANENTRQDEEVFTTGKSIIGQENYIPGSRKKKWGLISKIPIHTKTGEIIGLVGTFIDITSRKIAEETREALEKSLTTVSEAFFIARFDTHKYLYITGDIKKLYGYSSENFLKFGGKFWLEQCVFHEDKNIARKLPSSAKDKIRKEYRIVLPDGTIRWLASHISPETTYMNQKCNIIFEQDITDKKIAELKRERLENASNELSDCIWVGKSLDSSYMNFKYDYIGKPISKLFGIIPDDIYKSNSILFNIKKQFLANIKISNDKTFAKIQYNMAPNLSRKPKCYEEKIYKYSNNYYTGVIKDISEHILHSQIQELYESNVNINETISIYELENFNYLYLSAAHCNIFGYPTENFYKGGLKFWIDNCVYFDDKKKEEEYYNKGSWPSSRYFRIQRQNKEIRWIKTSIYKKEYFGSQCIIAISTDITNEKLASDQRIALERAIESSSNCFWVGKINKENKLNIIYVNDAYKNFINLLNKKHSEQNINNILVENESENLIKDFTHKNLSGKLPITKEYNFVDDKTGRIMWFNEKIDKCGNIIFGIIEDNTENKDYKEKILMLRELATSSEHCVFVKLNHKYIMLSPSTKIVYGYPKEKMLDDDHFIISNIVHPEDRKLEEQYYVSGKYPKIREYRIIKQDGTEAIVEETIFNMFYESQNYLWGIVRDITGNKLMNCIGKMFKDFQMSVVIYDLENNLIMLMNDPSNELFGYAKKSLKNYGFKFWLKYCVHKDFKKKYLNCLIKGIYSKNEVYKIIHPVKGVRWIESIITKEVYCSKKCLFIMSRDITDLQKKFSH